MAAIARENEIAPAQISEWKKPLEDRLGEVFQSKGERSRQLQTQERKETRLERKIGQLVVETDSLVRKCGQLGSIQPKSHDREGTFPTVRAPAVRASRSEPQPAHAPPTEAGRGR